MHTDLITAADGGCQRHGRRGEAVSIRHDQMSQLSNRISYSQQFNDSANRRDGGQTREFRSSASMRSVRRRGATAYLLGMVVVTMIGSAFVIGGLLAEAKGLSAIVLAAAMPAAGLLWAITLSVMNRE